MRRIIPAATVLLGLLMGHAEAASLPDSAPTSPCSAGEAWFRRARFEAAESAWEAALAANPSAACAHLGLSRIDQLRFRRRSARDHAAAAYRLAPQDPEVVLAYVAFVSDPDARHTLLQNVVVLAQEDSARARLLFEDRLAGRRAALASPYRGYRLKLQSFHPLDSTPAGVVLRASINSGKPLRLVLDTGADGIVLNPRPAREAGLERLGDAALGGAGERGAVPAYLALARSVAIDDLRIENCLVRVAASDLVPGADGVIGANVFQEFVLRLDAAARILELTPFAEGETAPASFSDPWMGYDAPDAPVRRLGHLLLLRGRVDDREDGYFLLDTGAAHSSLSTSLAGCSVAEEVGLRGAGGSLIAVRLQPVTLDIGGQRLVDTDPVAFDFNPISRREGVEISGMIGFSLLSRSVVTINYRDGVVQLSRH